MSNGIADRLELLDLSELVNGAESLVRRGRHLAVSFLVEIGTDAFLVRIAEGRVVSLESGPFVMPNWTFAVRIDREAWSHFVSPSPPPGYHDLFALLKFGRLRLDGDLHPFMANLLYFKLAFESLRRRP